MVRSFASAVGEGGGRTFLVDFVFLTVVDLVSAQDHSCFSCSFWVVVPDRFFRIDFFFLLHGSRFDGFFGFPVIALVAAETDTALIVVGIET